MSCYLKSLKEDKEGWRGLGASHVALFLARAGWALRGQSVSLPHGHLAPIPLEAPESPWWEEAEVSFVSANEKLKEAIYRVKEAMGGG